MHSTTRRHRYPALVGILAGSVLLTAVPSAATAVGAGTGIGDPYFPDDGNPGYDVSHYDVRVAYDPARPDRLTGDTTVSATATGGLDRLNLDLEGFEVGSVTVDGSPAKSFTRSGAHELVITPARRIAKGQHFAVRVRYSGKPVGRSWHRFADGGANVTGEPHSATAWYPANDHPSDKATFRLTATVPDTWTVIGNGRPGPATSSADGTKTFRWYEDKPLATYVSTIAIGKFTVNTSKLADGTPVINAYGPGAVIDPDAEALLPEIIGFLSSKFGPYPFSSAGGIVTGRPIDDGSGPLALETQSRPTYEGMMFDASMVHEYAHQWFGNSVSFSDWRDGCLAECFAQYTNQLWEEKGGADLDTGFYADTVEENRENPGFWNVKLYDPGQGKELDPALYDKGPLMLHALRRTVGDAAFFGTLRRWQKEHRYGNASWPQFEALAKKVSPQRDLTGFFDAWVHGTVIPERKYLYPTSLGAVAAAGDR
ncbi:M1 family metallopeptidase [Streptomyces sp. NBC_00654]|uniref:M1 family metallopeptidase n=1 Tax=Streptomyces sp. NBC_00654 TaxID=2975799 RepID=UPI00224DA55E|nr:M1 family metallopeptidase [Streptomyces sp. NBC_00654]MCX4967568.1 M1 family metallopeptidase [Streptomyces sp. NBC_00654]